MKSRILSVIGILVLLVGITPVSVIAAPPPPNYSPVDVGPEIRGWAPTADRIEPVSQQVLAEQEKAAEALVNASATDCITDSRIFLILNDYLGRYQATYFNLMGDSPASQVWVQVNLAWPAGDPRATPVITCDQVNYMTGQFNNNILPKETSFFGPPNALDGTYALLPSLLGLPADYYVDPTGRQIILVENIRDENYYDSTYPIYIAGFYTGSFEAYFDRNVISIDAYDWANRTGPSGTRPYLYEGVFAHEYQHLLHDDYDPGEENFVNEGMADLAEYLTGYGIGTKGHVDAAASNPENSLVVWGDQGDLEILTDYGQAYLFQYYLMEQYGKPFIQALFHNQLHGISGINSTLASLNIQKTFANVYHDWSVGMLINSKTPADARYLFKNVDSSLYFYFKPLNIGTPSAPNLQAFNTPGAPPWGADYIWVNGDPKKLGKFSFNGVPYSMFPSAWTSDGNVLWGGAGDLIDNWAIFEAPGGGALTFDTKYDIEPYWDFGFVQVSTDSGRTWTSLANAYTTSDHDPAAYSTVVANLPGLTGSTGGAWVNMSFDLSPYAGQNVLVAFRYVTDWATSEAGWFIDNVSVDGTLISDGSSMVPFKDITEVVPIDNNFTVTFVGYKGTGSGAQYKIAHMKLSGDTEAGLFELNKVLKWSDKAAMLVTLDAPEGFTHYGNYTYSFTFTNAGPKKKK
jgi:immune inhibitor A